MADPVLPSRVVAEGILDDLYDRVVAEGILDGKYDEDAGTRIVADLLRLVASGRLVDREAIDYGAAYEKAETLGLQPWPFDLDDIELIVAAAIGDDEQHGVDWRIEAEADRRADQ